MIAKIMIVTGTILLISGVVCSRLLSRTVSDGLQCSEPGFHFEIVSEAITSEVYPMSKARVFIARKDYNRANLECFFKWYSLKHNRKNELITVLVFTRMDYLAAHLEIEKMEVHRFLNNDRRVENKINVSRNGPLYDAFFRREVSDTGEVNELFTYFPNPDAPEISETVVIKGRDPFSINNRK